MMENFAIRPLQSADIPALVSLLQSQSSEYVRFFTPFSFDQATITNMLTSREQDLFIGMYWRDRLAGFFMLRGWDEGYEVPAYGVLIDEEYSGYGLTTLSLRMAKAAAKLRGSTAIMLKVHPANTHAKRLFERAGFVQTGVDSRSGSLIYFFRF